MAGQSCLLVRRPDQELISSAAFTAVPARRTLGFSSTTTISSAAPVEQTPSQKVAWSENVREYVQKSFSIDNVVPGVTQAEMQTKLKEVINWIAERKGIEEIDWSQLPLPQHIIQQERRDILGSASAQQRPSIWQDSLAGLQLQSPTIPDPNMRKRKIGDENAAVIDPSNHAETQAPWHTPAPRNVFEDRISYPTLAEAATKKGKDKKQKKESNFGSNVAMSSADLDRRRQRFDLDRFANSTSASIRDVTPMLEANDGPVIGTSQSLEKNYFRLTAPPKPETVRPLPILQQTLELLKKKWRQDNNYGYICDQFKSLRQDLTVQHIKNDFTVSVYELHARIALEKMDLGEYNQCQTQLRALYKQHLGGHPAEFLAYRILYFIYTCNRTDMNDVLSDLTRADREQPAVKHALEVRSALASGNYHRFFQLYLDTPNMGGYLMDIFVNRERLAAMASLCKAYKPDLSLRFLTEELGFESDQDCASFICDHGGQNLLENKEGALAFAAGKAGQVFQRAKDAAFRRVDLKGQI